MKSGIAWRLKRMEKFECRSNVALWKVNHVTRQARLAQARQSISHTFVLTALEIVNYRRTWACQYYTSISHFQRTQIVLITWHRLSPTKVKSKYQIPQRYRPGSTSNNFYKIPRQFRVISRHIHSLQLRRSQLLECFNTKKN